MKIVIVGCGISGLSTAYVLQNEGFEVEIITKDLLENTVSNVAAAIWFPFKAEPMEDVIDWSAMSYDYYYNLKEIGWKGIETVDLQILTNDNTIPFWADIFPAAHKIEVIKAENTTLPKGYNFALELQTFVIETPIFMPFLRNKFIEKGGRITKKTIHNFDNFVQKNQDNIVINCTGLGAKTLVNDTELFPIQGQLVKIEKQPLVNRAVFDDDEQNAIAYIVPRADALILGGTVFAYKDNKTPDLITEKDIIRRCQNIEPNLAAPVVLDSMVGLRPGRSTVRVERELNRNVIHNYGHGGSGYTINWGCALDILDMVRLIML